MEVISVVDFSDFPGLRHSNISDDSGEDFYHTVLNNKFKEAYENETGLKVILDYVVAYTSSFLDEAFGNLVYDFSLETVKKYLTIESVEEPHWIDMIYNETFPQWESRRIKNEKPVVTKTHEPWYRIHNKELILKAWELP